MDSNLQLNQVPEDFEPEILRVEHSGEIQNLYQILHNTVFNHKKSEGKDIGHLIKLVTDETRATFKCVDIGKNMEKSCFSISLTDMNDMTRLIAHASFTDIPTEPSLILNGKRWRKKKELAKATSTNTLFMSIFVCRDDESKETCIQEIIANTFSACESVEFIIIECPDIDYDPGSYAFSPLVSEVLFKSKADLTMKLIIYSKEILMPKLTIRYGRELDLDDLIPILKVDAKDLEETFNKGFLVELIAMSERTKNSMVAEFEGYAVGMVAVTAEINYSLLNEQFHLEPFHGLFKPFPKDEINCCPVDSRLFGPTGSSEIRLTETFDPKERAHARQHDEDQSIVSLAEKEELATPGEGGEGDQSGIGFDDEVMSLFVSKVTSETSKKPSGDQGFLSSETNDQRFIRRPYRRESTLNRNYETMLPKEQEQLLIKVRGLMRRLEEKGESLETATLDPTSIRILTEAQGFINYCISRYLHKTLIDDKILPIVNLNEPPASVFHGIPNAIALQLVALENMYQVRINELINGAFTAFPTRDYCIVTTPSGAPELPWMKYFVRVSPKTTALHAKTLYVMHRACFSSTIRVRHAKLDDFDKVENLVEKLFESAKVLRDFKASICPTHNTKELHSFVAEVTSHLSMPIIALLIVGPENNPVAYQINYDLDQYTYFDLHDVSTDHAYVHHFVINPIFQPHTKVMMKEAMRLLKKDCFYHKIYPPAVDPKYIQNQTLLNNLEDWIALIPRRQIEYSLLNLKPNDPLQPPKAAQGCSSTPYAAFHYSKKFTYEPKAVVSKRVVFIGASETTLSCLEKIIESPYFDFKNLTLISTHGLPGSLPHDEIRNLFFPRKNGPALSMKSSEEWHQRLSIRSVVTTVYGTAVRIFRKIKVVVVDDSKVVPYDLLVFATGRQFIRPDHPEPRMDEDRLDKFKQNLSKKEEYEKPIVSPITPKPKNVFLINTEVDALQALNLLRSFIPFVSNRQIIVHGACLEAYCCVRALIELGISPHRITFVVDRQVQMEWEAYSSFRDTRKLRELMNETFSQLGIQVLHDCNFRRWNMDLESGICTRVYFTSIKNIGIEKQTKISVPCIAYFSFSVRRVDDNISKACSWACLPYNNGIIINTSFETHDRSIMAAGPCAVYDKKLCADNLNHYFFSSYEVGQVLGDFILRRIVPRTKSINVNVVGRYSHFPPELITPLVHYADLPGGWYYMHVSRPAWIPNCCREAACTCKDCECGIEIITGSVCREEDAEQKFFRLRLDKYQRVDAMECISRKKFPPSCLSSLYGHHVAFLNKLMERLEKKEIIDLYEHFCQPWVAALSSDRWCSFRREVKEIIDKYDIWKGGVKLSDLIRDYLNNLDNPDLFQVDPNILRHVFENTNLKAAVENKFLNFLKYNKAVLPMYARPDFVEETYNERTASPMYVPLHKNFAL